MLWKLSLVISSAAGAAAVYFIIAGTEDWGPSLLAAGLTLAVVAALLVGPHFIFAILAFAIRSDRVLSATLFAFIVLISVLGALFLAHETDAFLSRDRTVPGRANLGMFVVGVVQWISALLLSAIMLPIYFFLGGRPEGPASQKSDVAK